MSHSYKDQFNSSQNHEIGVLEQDQSVPDFRRPASQSGSGDIGIITNLNPRGSFY